MSKRKFTTVLGATLVLAMASSGVEAQKLYRWVDKDGKVHYSDHVPPEAVDQARDTLNDQGRPVDHVERAMTEEERAAFEADLARQAEEAARAEEQAKQDRILLTSYEDEAALERSFQERFDLLEQTLATTRLGIEGQEASLADLLEHAAGIEREGKKVPAGIATSIDTAERQVREQRVYLQRREAERAALQEEYERVLARYREVIARGGVDPD